MYVPSTTEVLEEARLLEPPLPAAIAVAEKMVATADVEAVHAAAASLLVDAAEAPCFGRFRTVFGIHLYEYTFACNSRFIRLQDAEVEKLLTLLRRGIITRAEFSERLRRPPPEP